VNSRYDGHHHRNWEKVCSSATLDNLSRKSVARKEYNDRLAHFHLGPCRLRAISPNPTSTSGRNQIRACLYVANALASSYIEGTRRDARYTQIFYQPPSPHVINHRMVDPHEDSFVVPAKSLQINIHSDWRGRKPPRMHVRCWIGYRHDGTGILSRCAETIHSSTYSYQ
jgi:hypothetical protein